MDGTLLALDIPRTQPTAMCLEPIPDDQQLPVAAMNGATRLILVLEQALLARNSHTGEGVERGAWGEQASVWRERASGCLWRGLGRA